MANNVEISKALCRLFIKIVEQEKIKAIKADDYGAVFIASILEGIFKETELSFLKHGDVVL